MAAGGGPTPEQWAKMTRGQKLAYWICVGAAFALISGLLIKKFFFS